MNGKGYCFDCGRQGHWLNECPQNPATRMNNEPAAGRYSGVTSQYSGDIFSRFDRKRSYQADHSFTDRAIVHRSRPYPDPYERFPSMTAPEQDTSMYYRQHNNSYDYSSCSPPNVPQMENRMEMSALKRESSYSYNVCLHDSKEIKNEASSKGEKVKILLLLSYVGESVFGFKKRKGRGFNKKSTIEKALLMALLKADVISIREFNNPKLIEFRPAINTERNVSAARNFVSLMTNLKEIPDSLPNIINTFLPPQVKVIAIRKLPLNYYLNPMLLCQTYSYMLPTFALALTAEERNKEYRISEHRLQTVKEFLKNYVEELSFYNYLPQRGKKRIMSCEISGNGKPTIKSCQCSSPFELYGHEFCLIKIKCITEGYSKIIKWIRHVVGLAIATMQNITNIKECFMNETIKIPLAPGFSTILEGPHFDCCMQRNRYPTDIELLQWMKESENSIEIFKHERICLNIAEVELKETFILQWLSILPYHLDAGKSGQPTIIASDRIKSEPITESESEEEIGNSIGHVNDIQIKSEPITETEIKVEIGNRMEHINETHIKSESMTESKSEKEIRNSVEHIEKIQVKPET